MKPDRIAHSPLPMKPDPFAPRPDVPDRKAVQRAFGRAAATYDDAAVLQKEVGARMAERLEVVRLAPQAVLDAGCGTGEALAGLGVRYPQARRVALDLAVPMLEIARERHDERRSVLHRLAATLRGSSPPAPAFVAGDIAALPFAPAAFDLVWSNLALQWVDDLGRAFGELHRVLRVGGLLTFTTFGPDTLKELRIAFRAVDAEPHVSRFVDMHDIGDLLVQTGFADPVMHMEMITLTYREPRGMMQDLKAIGATNATRGRPRGMLGRGRWERLVAALEGMRREGVIPATFEVVHGHAWKTAPTHTAEGHAIVHLERRRR